MQAHTADTVRVLFGWDPMWVSGVIFLATYLFVISDRLNRAIVTMIGAGLMIILGVMNQEAAIRGVDFNTIGLLIGMMVIVSITRKTGVFQYVAIWSVKKVQAQPWRILLALSVVTAIFSAFLDNVTTVLLVAPVTLLISEELEISPYPLLFAEIFASNIGGAATLVGDPPNIMIGSAVKLSFNDFIVNVAPIIPVILLVTLGVLYLVWGRTMQTTPALRKRVMSFREQDAISDAPLLRSSLCVLALVVIGFVFAHVLNLEPATIAMTGGALLLLLSNLHNNPEEQSGSVQRSFAEVEWVTIFFFVGLFVVVHGIESTGVLKVLAAHVLEYTGGDLTKTAVAVLWGSAISSTIVDNIPFVATMIPVIESMSPVFGGDDKLAPLWWSLSLGACLGGNGSLIGASANLIVAGFAERAGHRIHFLSFMAFAFPLMLMSIVIANLYIYLRYL